MSCYYWIPFFFFYYSSHSRYIETHFGNFLYVCLYIELDFKRWCNLLACDILFSQEKLSMKCELWTVKWTCVVKHPIRKPIRQNRSTWTVVYKMVDFRVNICVNSPLLTVHSRNLPNFRWLYRTESNWTELNHCIQHLTAVYNTRVTLASSHGILLAHSPKHTAVFMVFYR